MQDVLSRTDLTENARSSITVENSAEPRLHYIAHFLAQDVSDILQFCCSHPTVGVYFVLPIFSIR